MSDSVTNRLSLTRFVMLVMATIALGSIVPFAAFSRSGPAQNASGQVVGTVSNTAGEKVSRATVILSARDGRTLGIAVTDVHGRFALSRIPAGSYVLQVFGNGFGPSLRTSIEVGNEQNVTQDVTLDLVSKNPGRAGDSLQSAKQYKGELVSIDVNDLNIRAFFAWIHEVSGTTIIVDSDARERLLDRTVTLDSKNAPWDQVLDVVVMKYGLTAYAEGDAIRITLNSPTSR